MWPNKFQGGSVAVFLEGRNNGIIPYTDFSTYPELYKVAFQTMIMLAREMGHQKSRLTLSPM